jgi:methyl-accepting chemotaxis protein
MNYLPIFVAVTSAAVVIQAGIIVAMFVTMRKTMSRVDSLSTQVVAKVLPVADAAQAMFIELRPKIDSLVSNINETTAVVRAQVERLDAAANDVLDRARQQAIRADEMVGSALDTVEEATASVQRAVSIPVRQFSGIVRGVTAGFEYLATKKRREGAPQDEMFI